MKSLIVYYSSKGYMEEVAGDIQNELGSSAGLLNLKSRSRADLSDYDAVILCGAFHAGRLPGKLRRYASKNCSRLLAKKLAFVLGGLDTEGYAGPFEKNIPEALRQHASLTIHTGGRYMPEEHSRFIQNLMAKINKDSGEVHKEQKERLQELYRDLN
ncbi:MAG: flavodoxin domain-containing protein [Spirochaetales bacterium]|nr:flavodoxin domain-containing protein [Spirochaetales bacterium]